MTVRGGEGRGEGGEGEERGEWTCCWLSAVVLHGCGSGAGAFAEKGDVGGRRPTSAGWVGDAGCAADGIRRGCSGGGGDGYCVACRVPAASRCCAASIEEGTRMSTVLSLDWQEGWLKLSPSRERGLLPAAGAGERGESSGGAFSGRVGSSGMEAALRGTAEVGAVSFRQGSERSVGRSSCLSDVTVAGVRVCGTVGAVLPVGSSSDDASRRTVLWSPSPSPAAASSL